MNDILLNMNKQHVTILALLDPSSAFNTVDHSILLNRLSSKLGLNGTALAWFRSYLSGLSQRVSVRGAVSDKFDLHYGVPQGSCLGPLLFTVYASALFDVVEKHLPTVHLTNRFHVAVRLFSNRSQMTSKCGKNKKVAHEAIAECVTDVLTTF